MSEVSLLRMQFQEVHSMLESTMEDVTPELAHWTPPGKANPLGANYAHLVMNEDMGIHRLVKGVVPLAEGSWADRVGVSEPAPLGGRADWHDWARRVRVNLPALRQYARAVYAATDECLASLADEELNRSIDLTAFGFGQPTLRWVLSTTLQNVGLHCGEISCLKGIQGLRGYPV